MSLGELAVFEGNDVLDRMEDYLLVLSVVLLADFAMPSLGIDSGHHLG